MNPITEVTVGLKFIVLEQGRDTIIEVLKVGEGDEGERFEFPATDVLGDAACAELGQDSGYAQPDVNVPFSAGTVYLKKIPRPPNDSRGGFTQNPPAENGNGFFQTAESGREQGNYDADSDTFTPME